MNLNIISALLVVLSIQSLLVIFFTVQCSAGGVSVLIRYRRYCVTCGCCSSAKVPVQTQPKYENPCPFGEPILNYKNSPVYCSWQTADSCPINFWCHVGATVSTTTCCSAPLVSEDQCGLPMAFGFGNSNLPRWYFDKASQTCISFIYNGLKGNSNNFLTKYHCQTSCQTKFPCQQINFDKRSSGFCTLTSDACSSGYFCHQGVNIETTMCCPRLAVSPCQLGLSVGQGPYQLSRWFYDELNNECKMFTYFGLKGNENNFLTKDSCESTCLIKRPVNPCSVGEPVSSCFNGNACPKATYCHYGESDINLCCPSIGNVCEQSVQAGEGGASLKRWFFDTNRGICLEFTYNGRKGNANNFLTESECQKTCFGTGWQNLCPTGRPLMSFDNTPRFCSNSSSDCPVGFWCHIGPDDKANVCCPKSGNLCTLAPVSGSGNFLLPRWYYEQSSKLCKPFTYYGFKGNENNFLTAEHCQEECQEFENPCGERPPAFDIYNKRPVKCKSSRDCPNGYYCHGGTTTNSSTCCYTKKEICQLPVAIGQGDATLMRWYFDPDSKRCSLFWYKGYKGNANNFLNRDECLTVCPEPEFCWNGGTPYKNLDGSDALRCSAGDSSCPVSHFCNVGFDSYSSVCCPKLGDACTQPFVEGHGPGSLSRFYFDNASNKCRHFLYKGYGGTENNFVSETECIQRCGKNTLPYCPHGEPLYKNEERLPRTCKNDANCSEYYICHINAEIGSSVCCPEPEHFCLLPRDPGLCLGTVARYAFDPSSNTCVKFLYGGCGGNLNNFHSIEVCTEICCSQLRLRRR